MSDALIARLRTEGTGANRQGGDPDFPLGFLFTHGALCLEAADALSALREERDRLRAALTELVACDEIVKHLQHADGKKVRAGRWQAAWESARAALGERSGERE